MTDYERQLEERIDCGLKGLPELQAPPALTGRIMAAVLQRVERPWYRRPWQAWPLASGWTRTILADAPGLWPYWSPA